MLHFIACEQLIVASYCMQILHDGMHRLHRVDWFCSDSIQRSALDAAVFADLSIAAGIIAIVSDEMHLIDHDHAA